MFHKSQELEAYNKASILLKRNKDKFLKESESFANEINLYAKTQAINNKMIDQEWVKDLTIKFHSHLARAVLIHYEEYKLSKLSKKTQKREL